MSFNNITEPMIIFWKCQRRNFYNIWIETNLKIAVADKNPSDNHPSKISFLKLMKKNKEWIKPKDKKVIWRYNKMKYKHQ
jgi:hypothetical protein